MYYGWKNSDSFRLFDNTVPFEFNGTEFNIGASDVLHVREWKSMAINSHDGRYGGGTKSHTEITALIQDTNLARLDGSVYTEFEVEANDSRFEKVPYELGGFRSNDYLMLPKEMR